MIRILNRYQLFVVIAISALFVFGCSSTSGEDPQRKANEAVAQANESIDRHNRLFERSRDTYTDVKARLENGDDPAEQRSRITEARDTLEEARTNLEEAREPLRDVRGLDVDPAVKDYAGLLSKAMAVQLAAEAKEIRFYDILEEDPTLKDNRERALDLLSEIGDDYERAEEIYGEARELADSKPGLIVLPPGGSDASTGSTPPETTEETTS